MPFATHKARLLLKAARRRPRIRIPERALLGAAMSGALLIAERRLNRVQGSRAAIPPSDGSGDH
jgi:hypothetical protein